MKNNLVNVRSTLRELLKALPAVKAKGCQDAVQKHLALIRFYQRQYDSLIANPALS